MLRILENMNKTTPLAHMSQRCFVFKGNGTVSFHGSIGAVTRDGQVSDDLTYERQQGIGPLRRDRVPGAQIRVIDALLRVQLVM